MTRRRAPVLSRWAGDPASRSRTKRGSAGRRPGRRSGVAGGSAVRQGRLLRFGVYARSAVLVGLLAAAAATAVLADVPVVWRVAAASVCVGAAVVVLRGVKRDGRRRSSRWSAGAVGEQRTARALVDLGPGWTVLHDLRVPGSKANIDHVAVGPGGVWVIDSKNYRGRMTVRGTGLLVDGESVTGRVRTTRWEASCVAGVLADAEGVSKVRVRAAWAVWGATLAWGGAKEVGGVSVVAGAGVGTVVRSRSVALLPGEVEDVVRVLRESLPAAA